jgi:hypothetical protein
MSRSNTLFVGKGISLLLAFVMTIGPAMYTHTALAGDCEQCNGTASGYSGPTAPDTSATCGICDSAETAVRTRTVAHCGSAQSGSCTESNMTTERSCSSETVGVSAEAMDICDQQYQNQNATLQALAATCVALGTGTCLLGCAVFTVAYGVCAAACSGGISAACAAAYAYDHAGLVCDQSDCKYSCESTGWSSTDSEDGCG